MKNMNNKLANKNRDPIEEARKSEKFRQYSENVMPRIRLATEVYNSRKALGLSQQALAKEMNSTQKVVSKVENGDMNLGIELLNRFADKLHFNSDHLARVFNCGQAYVIVSTDAKKNETKNELRVMGRSENMPLAVGTIVSGTAVTYFPSASRVVSASNTIKHVKK